MNAADQGKPGKTRRSFMQAGTAAIVTSSAASAFAAPAGETLAINGGSKAVTVPNSKIAEMGKWPRYGEQEKKLVADLLDDNRGYGQIPMLEKELCAYLDVPYAKAHCNGTSALLSTFFALQKDLPPGSEILAPSYTAWATTAPMHLFGFVPAFVDVNPRTQTFDVEDAAKRMTARTRAVLPMHSFGNVCDMDHINDFAKKHGLIVVEDACQAQGASLKGKRVGTWGSIGCYSNQASKVVPGLEGGAGVYQTREYYERAVTFGNYELPSTFPADSEYRKYAGTGMGPKLRIHPLAAALVRIQLQKHDAQSAFVEQQLRKLNDRLAELPGIAIPYTRPDAKRVYWASNIIFIDEKKAGAPKEALMKALKAEGVMISPGYYDEQHKYVLYHEAKWWHHPVVIPDDLHGTTQVNAQACRLPLFYDDASEVFEQYVKAFEKVWANRSSLQSA